ncbi:DUF5995 family protein [Vallicoccus soli]|uniref:Uncharacterized protein n=1 Tax=Vallicoccus soli TaxID=2339232 RepID=A0A3A3ZME4_9ACTN|nr:DUF5995 family protein [Vallicoccus soli]RJK97815.1 hypothetical protein D5H78_02200 [Vallicoccus soli]
MAAASAVLVTGAGAGGASASLVAGGDGRDPLMLGWTSVLPPAVGTYDPGSEDACRSGRPQCLERTLRWMRADLDRLAAACHHSSVFALSYLRTTEEYGRAVATPGFFEDPRFLNHYDAVFAEFYVRAREDWDAGRRGDVPPAWRVAFEAAEQRRVPAAADLLLGINAHVNRDLPFVLAGIGLRAPDGTSRKRDHDAVNVFLNRVTEDLIDEAARRFDPSIDDAELPLGLTWTTLMQLLLTWRETAWRNAERLVAAPDEAARARVAAQVEATAEAYARSVVLLTSYLPPLTSPAARERHCAVHGRG